MRKQCLAACVLVLAGTSFASPSNKGAPVRSRHSTDERIRLIAPVAQGELRMRPTFVSCGVCWGASAEIPGLRLEYRAVGAGEWLAAPRFPYFTETKDYRGSILDLAEDSEYEVRLAAESGVVASGRFRTWSSEVKVGRTVVLDPSAVKFPIKVSDKGTADGWVRYTLPPGKTLVNTTVEPTFDVNGAQYVLLDRMRLVGGKGRHVVDLADSRAVRITNCDISGWGRVGEPRFDKFGRRHQPGRDNGYGINLDGAINIASGTSEIVVERCWIHDSLGHANSWFYSHPAGPEAITVKSPDHSVVIRWNDFIGSDNHRFNDAVESLGNFSEDGGLNRDSDVYGNFMALCNDDCIELDGGQQNVRCFDNRFETAFCGVSIQGCMASPVYVHRNVFAGMCDEFGAAGQTLKTGGGAHGEEAYAYIWKNLFWGAGNGVAMMELLRADVRDNIFCGRQGIRNISNAPKAVIEDNKMGAEIPEDALDPAVPVRPLPFVLTRARFSGIKVKLQDGKSDPPTLSFSAKWTGGADARSVSFSICQNADFDWFDVSPRQGIMAHGTEIPFIVRLKPERMRNRRYYRGAFLVRTDSGLSRVASIFAETDFVPPFKAEKPGEIALYADVTKPISGLASSRDKTFAFDVEKAGRYYFMIHGGGGRPIIRVSVDGSELAPSIQQTQGYPVWTMLTPGKKWGDRTKFYDFKPGRHTVRIRGHYDYDGLVLTDSPGSFEPR